MIKLIHPKTGVVREVEEGSVKISILQRAGFVPAKGYKAPVEVVPTPEPTLAEEVESQSEKVVVSGVEVAAEVAIHAEVVLPASPEIEISPSAQELIDEHSIDPSLLGRSGKDGGIIKADVLEYLGKAVEETEEAEEIEEAEEAEEAGEPTEAE